MKKPREFWINPVAIKEPKSAVYYEALDEPCADTVHVREVVPLDWEKMFNLMYAKHLNVDTGREEMQKIIELALKGEL